MITSHSDQLDEYIAELEAEVKRLRAEVTAALALHQMTSSVGPARALGCLCGSLWPCPTVKALTGGRE